MVFICSNKMWNVKAQTISVFHFVASERACAVVEEMRRHIKNGGMLSINDEMSTSVHCMWHKCQYCLKIHNVWDAIELRRYTKSTLASVRLHLVYYFGQFSDAAAAAAAQIIPYFKLIKINELKNVFYLAFGVSSKMHSSVFDSSTLLVEGTCTLGVLNYDTFG